MNKVTRFPISPWQRHMNERGDGRSVSCVVAERYLKFHKADEPGNYDFGNGRTVTPITIDVMSMCYDKPKDHKICELFLTIEDLEDMLKKIKSE